MFLSDIQTVAPACFLSPFAKDTFPHSFLSKVVPVFCGETHFLEERNGCFQVFDMIYSVSCDWGIEIINISSYYLKLCIDSCHFIVFGVFPSSSLA